LILPESYVDVDNEEMEYVDGGWSLRVFTKKYDWISIIKYSSESDNKKIYNAIIE